MTVADKARALSIVFEGKKTGLVQGQGSDWYLRLKLQASELCDQLKDAPLGTRYQMAMVEIGDDEQPVNGREVVQNTDRNSEVDTSPPSSSGSHNKPAMSMGAKKTWEGLKPAAQTGILRNDPSFQKFLHEFLNEKTYIVLSPQDVANAIHRWCDVISCSHIIGGTSAAFKWRALVERYRAWQKEPEVIG